VADRQLPLLQRFPALAQIPRVDLGVVATPVQTVVIDGTLLLLKRDDWSASPIGGNKVRGLEWLLGPLVDDPRRHVLTVGPRGSTHALATATFAHSLGASTTVVRWNQEMNPVARVVDERTRSMAHVIDARVVVPAYAIATALRARKRTLWIPAGGAAPVALLGHVNAALELAAQISTGAIERPRSVIVPFGTGGTAAGLILGFRIAELDLKVVAVRVVPRIVARKGRLIALARSAARLIESYSGRRLQAVRSDDVEIEHGFFAGRYGRPLPRVSDESALIDAGVSLDDTYSRKAFAAALSRPERPALLWLTFDGRILHNP